jgi:lysozyme
MTINKATVDLVKRWEGFRANAYLCPAGVWTVGYGTTSQAGIGVKVGPGVTVTREQAEAYLRQSLEKFAAKISPAITAPINENEFGAFLSLAYNIGVGAFLGSSALRHFNAGDKVKAAAAIKLWNKATVNGKRQVLKGLVDRREDEVRLFMAPVHVNVASQPLTSKPVDVNETAKNEHQSLLARLLAWFTGARQ